MKKNIQILLFIFCISVSAQQKAVSVIQPQIPEKFIGNWINTNTNNWEYGFFEKFAMYKSDFWNYKAIQTLKNGDVNLTLAKGKQTVQLLMKAEKDNRITVQTAKGNAVSYIKMDKVCVKILFQQFFIMFFPGWEDLIHISFRVAALLFSPYPFNPAILNRLFYGIIN